MLAARNEHAMKKRHFMLGALSAAGALTVGWALLPPRSRLGTPAPGSGGGTAPVFNGWVTIGRDSRVSVLMPKSEMGQGIHTALAMVLADELDADWALVGVEPAPLDNIYNNIATVVDGLPFHPDDQGALRQAVHWLTAKTMREVGSMVTGGSSSVKDLWLPMREAGAAARAMLVGAAAQAWAVPLAEVSADAGVLRHRSGRQARFGEFAAAAAALPLPEAVVLKQPAQFRLIGRDLPRLEAAAKGQGTARFGIDVRLPGMLYATVVMCPTLGGKVASFDAAAALQLPGVKKVVSVPGYNGGTAGVAVIADTPWHALQAIKQVAVSWDENVPAASYSSAAAMDQMAQRLDHDRGFSYHSVGDVDAALGSAARVIRAEYRAPFVAHHTLEPQNCTVLVKRTGATVWAPTQVPGFARWVAALTLDLPNDAVAVHVQLLGGGFGRRLEVDFVAQAAAIAKHMSGTPVQTFWTREEDTRHDFYRPAAVARMAAGIDSQGAVSAWQHVSAGPSIVHQVLRRLFGVPAFGMPDKTTAEGAFDQPYEWPNARIGHVAVESPVPVGFWRSVGHSHQAFFKESFIDEVAHAAQQDPVAFRSALLVRHPRQRAVLQRAAQLAGWGQPLADAADGARRARGVALHQSFGSTVAQVAEVSLGPDKTIRVHRVVCVIDCGSAVNPGLVRQQMESGIVFGLSSALYGGVTIEKGRVLQGNYNDQPLLRLDACPAIETEIMPSSEPPEGVGEPATPPIAPAVANAIFALTGERLRSLPLKPS